MKTLIAYASKHGCAEKCAHLLKKKLSGDVEVFDLKQKFNAEMGSFDTVVIGGSIHAGKIQSSIRKFCAKRLEHLRNKKIGLFLCCMEKGEKAQKQFDGAFPAELRIRASASGLFGGAFDFEKMNFFERAIIKKIAKLDRSVSKIDQEAISRFAEELNR